MWLYLQWMSRCYYWDQIGTPVWRGRGWPRRRERTQTSLLFNGWRSLLANKYLMIQTGGSFSNRAAPLRQTIKICYWTLETVKIDRLKIKHSPYYSEIPWAKTPVISPSRGIYVTECNLATLQDLVLNSCWVFERDEYFSSLTSLEIYTIWMNPFFVNIKTLCLNFHISRKVLCDFSSNVLR